MKKLNNVLLLVQFVMGAALIGFYLFGVVTDSVTLVRLGGLILGIWSVDFARKRDSK